jgi:hypothetical protein
VLIESSGQSPLLVQSLVLADENIGFGWGILEASPGGSQGIGVGARYQLDPGDFMTIQVSFRPRDPGLVETRLVAETNSGRMEVRLLAEGVN